MSKFKERVKNRKKFKSSAKLGLSHITILELIKVLSTVGEKRSPSDMFCRIILKQSKQIIESYFENPKGTKFDYKDLEEYKNLQKDSKIDLDELKKYDELAKN